ncbi:MAG: hypothetical protein KIT87_19040 [Anaerolineae bacterium]|nr:hypothetical protein [Anaerolineae bacterium]
MLPAPPASTAYPLPGLLPSTPTLDYHLPPEKREMFQRIESTRIAARSLPTTPPGTKAVIPTDLPKPFPTGIIESGLAPFPGSVYRFENQWQDLIGNELVHVYAGALRSDPSQGVLIVLGNLPDGSGGIRRGDFYLAPAKLGALRIVAADGTRLTVQAPDGPLWGVDIVFPTGTELIRLPTPMPATPAPPPPPFPTSVVTGYFERSR